MIYVARADILIKTKSTVGIHVRKFVFLVRNLNLNYADRVIVECRYTPNKCFEKCECIDNNRLK